MRVPRNRPRRPRRRDSRSVTRWRPRRRFTFASRCRTSAPRSGSSATAAGRTSRRTPRDRVAGEAASPAGGAHRRRISLGVRGGGRGDQHADVRADGDGRGGAQGVREVRRGAGAQAPRGHREAITREGFLGTLLFSLSRFMPLVASFEETNPAAASTTDLTALDAEDEDAHRRRPGSRARSGGRARREQDETSELVNRLTGRRSLDRSVGRAMIEERQRPDVTRDVASIVRALRSYAVAVSQWQTSVAEHEFHPAADARVQSPPPHVHSPHPGIVLRSHRSYTRRRDENDRAQSQSRPESVHTEEGSDKGAGKVSDGEDENRAGGGRLEALRSLDRAETAAGAGGTPRRRGQRRGVPGAYGGVTRSRPRRWWRRRRRAPSRIRCDCRRQSSRSSPRDPSTKSERASDVNRRDVNHRAPRRPRTSTAVSRRGSRTRARWR